VTKLFISTAGTAVSAHRHKPHKLQMMWWHYEILRCWHILRVDDIYTVLPVLCIKSVILAVLTKLSDSLLS